MEPLDSSSPRKRPWINGDKAHPASRPSESAIASKKIASVFLIIVSGMITRRRIIILDASGLLYTPCSKVFSVWSSCGGVGRETTSPAHSALAFWRSGLRQLKAIAMREHRSAATAIRGARLHACLDILSQVPTDRQVSLTFSHDELTVPALVSWFRTFQPSCTS